MKKLIIIAVVSTMAISLVASEYVTKKPDMIEQCTKEMEDQSLQSQMDGVVALLCSPSLVRLAKENGLFATDEEISDQVLFLKTLFPRISFSQEQVKNMSIVSNYIKHVSVNAVQGELLESKFAEISNTTKYKFLDDNKLKQMLIPYLLIKDPNSQLELHRALAVAKINLLQSQIGILEKDGLQELAESVEKQIDVYRQITELPVNEAGSVIVDEANGEGIASKALLDVFALRNGLLGKSQQEIIQQYTNRSANADQARISPEIAGEIKRKFIKEYFFDRIPNSVADLEIFECLSNAYLANCVNSGESTSQAQALMLIASGKNLLRNEVSNSSARAFYDKNQEIIIAHYGRDISFEKVEDDIRTHLASFPGIHAGLFLSLNANDFEERIKEEALRILN